MPTDSQESADLPQLGQPHPVRGKTVVALTLVMLLIAAALGLIFQGGAYGPSTWLPLMMAVAALGLVVAIAGPAMRSNRIQKTILALFVLQAAWTAASLLWAGSRADAWQEINRTVFYAITLVLVFAAIRLAGLGALKAVASSVLVAGSAVAIVVLVQLGISSHPLDLFLAGRLYYPVTYFNGLAALLMVAFWLALGMANGARGKPKGDDSEAEAAQPVSDTDADAVAEADADADAEQIVSRVAWRRSLAGRSKAGSFPRWTQPLCLTLAVVLAEVATLPQSRGALWTFFLVIPFFLILSPHRFRALVDLLIIIVPVVLFWNSLNGPYLAITGGTSLNAAITSYLTALGYSVAIVIGLWALTWLVERSIGQLRKRVALWVGVGLASAAILGAAGAVVYADIHTGGIDDYLSDRWQEFTADDEGIAQGASRFTGVGLHGRLAQWEVAYDAFREHPALGLGAQNFEDYWYLHRTQAFTVQQPHSQPMQLLAELSIPGVFLWLAFITAVFVRTAILRFRSPSRGQQVVLAAVFTASLSWFVHSSADWLWQLAGVTLPVMMLFGAMLGADREMGSADLSRPQQDGAPNANGRRDKESDKPWLSRLVRLAAVALALGAIASAAFPYLSSRFSAIAAGAADPQQAQSRADTAAWLDPTSTEPYAALASVYSAAAAGAPTAAERLNQLRLAAEAWQEAIAIDPQDWILEYQAAETLFAARNAARQAGTFSVVQELDEQAQTHLEEARRLNPLSPEVTALEESL